MTRTIYITSALVLAATLGACNRREERAQREHPSTTEQRPSTPAEQRPYAPAEPRTERPSERSERAAEPSKTQPAGFEKGEKREAEAKFTAAKGYKVSGDVGLKEVAHGVEVSIALHNAPAGRKSVFVSEKKDCSDLEGASMGARTSAGEHRQSGKHQSGDLGRIETGKDGSGKFKTTEHGANLKPNDPHSMLSKAIVIELAETAGHERTAMKPIACAVVEPG